MLYALGQLLIEGLRRGQLGAVVAVVVLILLIVGFGWLIKFFLKAWAENKRADIQLKRDKFQAEQIHLRKLEGEPAEWRAHQDNHMKTHNENFSKATEKLGDLIDATKAQTAKNIESMKLIDQKLSLGFHEAEEAHKRIERRLDG